MQRRPSAASYLCRWPANSFVACGEPNGRKSSRAFRGGTPRTRRPPCLPGRARSAAVQPGHWQPPTCAGVLRIRLWRAAKRTAESLAGLSEAVRLEPGLAHAAHAFHSLWTLTAAFHAHAPVQNRAGIVGPAWRHAAQKFASALAKPHASRHSRFQPPPAPARDCRRLPGMRADCRTRRRASARPGEGRTASRKPA